MAGSDLARASTRGVAGRAAVAGDQPEHDGGIQQHRVRGGKVGGHEDERMLGHRHSRRGHAAQSRDHPARHVGEVGGAFGEPAAELFQRGLESGERLVHRPLAGGAGLDAAAHLLNQARVLGHHRHRGEDRLRLGAGPGAAALQFLRHVVQRGDHGGELERRVPPQRHVDGSGSGSGIRRTVPTTTPRPTPTPCKSMAVLFVLACGHSIRVGDPDARRLC